MKKSLIILTFSVALLSSTFTNCMHNPNKAFKTEDHYDYSIGSYKLSPETFTIKNKKTNESFNLNGANGNISSLIIFSGYVIASEQKKVYIWDLKNKYKACKIHFLAKILNYSLGLWPIKKLKTNVLINTLYISKDYKNLCAKEKDSNDIKNIFEIDQYMSKRLQKQRKANPNH